MDKIRIELVVVNGMLVGKRHCDRWNLAQLGWLNLPHSRNSAALKKARRFDGDCFQFAIVKGDTVAMTDEDRALYAAPVVARRAA